MDVHERKITRSSGLQRHTDLIIVAKKIRRWKEKDDVAETLVEGRTGSDRNSRAAHLSAADTAGVMPAPVHTSKTVRQDDTMTAGQKVDGMRERESNGWFAT